MNILTRYITIYLCVYDNFIVIIKRYLKFKIIEIVILKVDSSCRFYSGGAIVKLFCYSVSGFSASNDSKVYPGNVFNLMNP